MIMNRFRAASARATLAGIVLAMATSAASAESPRDVLAKYGMLGKWAYDCSKPPSDDNFYTVFARQADGEVRRIYLVGPDKIYNQYLIGRARMQDDHTLWTEMFAADKSGDKDKADKHVTVLIERKENKYHVIGSQIVDGAALVDNETYTRTSANLRGKKDAGTKAPWSEKCD